MSQDAYDETVEIRRLAPAAPAVIWGAVMIASLAGAGAVLWSGPQAPAVTERLVAASEDLTLRRDLARLAAERDALAGRLAALERGVGELKLAARGLSAPETTGSIGRPPAAAAPAAPAPAPEAKPVGFGLSFGSEISVDAVRRRWSALVGRHPQLLAKLQPRTQRSVGQPPAYDLVAGPFATRAEADRTCAALAEQGLACDTTGYAGDPIARP